MAPDRSPILRYALPEQRSLRYSRREVMKWGLMLGFFGCFGFLGIVGLLASVVLKAGDALLAGLVLS